jgi:hypothetical protein
VPNGLALAAERAGIEILDFVAAIGALFNLFRKRVNANTLVRVLADRNAVTHSHCLGHRMAGETNGQQSADGEHFEP